MKTKYTVSRSALALVLMIGMLCSMWPTAFAGQENGYHDPAEHWKESNDRTNELDVNAVVTHESFFCWECDRDTSFLAFRTPEYTRDGQTAMSRNVKYSDGTLVDGRGQGSILDGIPGEDAYYTGYHWTKAVCETCGGINTNIRTSDYGYQKDLYWLYDCASNFFEALPEEQTTEQVDSAYHRITTTSGEYCGFCYGTYKETASTLEKHRMESSIRPELAHDRFVEMDACADCGYAETAYTAAKAVIADYFGVVDGQPHTVTVSDLSETGVTTAIRYGHAAEACTLTSAPNFTEAGDYPVYYEITYTFQNTDMVEDGVAYVHLRDESAGENDGDGTCGAEHNWTLLDSTPATCLTLGYDRYLCVDCGAIEKRDYEAALGHAFQSMVIRDATCETPGKVLEICERCGMVQESTTPEGEHAFAVTTIPATCTSPGYTQNECSVCGERHITDITPVLAHNYAAHTTPPTCEGGGKTLHFCEGCGSSFVTDYTDPLGHSWDEGTEVTGSTCTGEGMTQYTCIRCGTTRLEGDAAAGHVPDEAATCTEPQLCLNCGAVIENALGHDYQAEVTAPTCTEMGFTTFTCSRCGDTYKGDYTDAVGHTPGEWMVDTEPTTDRKGSQHRECTVCGEVLDTEEIEKIYKQATTDSKGEAIVGQYLVIVTDTDTKNPVANAAVSLLAENGIFIRLPDGRLLDYADQTTVTVLLHETEEPVEGMEITVADQNANASGGTTDAAGQVTVPGTSDQTNEDGNTTVGWEDDDGERWTLTVTVEAHETGRPIPDAEVSVGKSGNITVILPDGTDMDEHNRITVTVTNHERVPQQDVTVIVRSDLGGTAQGKTNKDGKLTVPAVESADTDETGTAVVGQYTVIVTNREEIPIQGARVTLLPGAEESEDAFTVRLPNGRLLDGNDQTVVTVLLPDTTPAKGRNVEVSDSKDNHAAKDTDQTGKIIVPDASGRAGEIIGTDTGDEDTSNTVNVDVTDQEGNPVDDAEIEVEEDGTVSVTLSDDFDFDEDGPVTVTVTNNEGDAVLGTEVTVTDGTGTAAAGETDESGMVTLPDEYHFAYIVGYDDGTVGPERSMTRAEAAAVFARILAEYRGESPENMRASKFPDVDVTAWYAGYVAYLEKMGLVIGFADGGFHPEANITRAEFVTICVRLSDWIDLTVTETKQGSFLDVTGNHWAVSAIHTATRSGWIVGYPDGKFHPEDEITRAEVVTIVNRMLDRTADEAFVRQRDDDLVTFYDLQNPHYWAYYDLMEAANGHSIVTGAEEEIWHEIK